MIYLDYAATTPLSSRAEKALNHALRQYPWNPSSMHSGGIQAKMRYNEAKDTIAACLGTTKNRLVFTGSGSEASNLAIKGFHMKHPQATILTSAVEHHATLNTAKHLEDLGVRVEVLPVDSEGRLDPDALKHALKTHDNVLLSLIYANNETGTIQDIHEIQKILKPHRASLHLDMVQAPLHRKVRLEEMNVDYASFSAHKCFGPKGLGALYVKDKDTLTPLVHGGGHEYGLRAGTENLPQIAAFEAALKEAEHEMDTREARIADLSGHFLSALDKASIPYKVNGPSLNGRRLRNILNIGFKGQRSEHLLLRLDKAGIAASMGSACDSDTIEASHVLSAIGVDEAFLNGSLRFSLSHREKKEDLDYVASVLTDILK